MPTFTIENHAVALAGGAPLKSKPASGSGHFSSLKQLEQLAAHWPMSRLVGIWNNLPGLTPVQRFTDRQCAVRRIWKALQTNERAATQPDRSAGVSRSRKPVARAGSKKARIIRMVQRPKGATLAEIMRATAWQAHTVRAFISRSLVRDMGLRIVPLRRSEGQRAYSQKS